MRQKKLSFYFLCGEALISFKLLLIFSNALEQGSQTHIDLRATFQRKNTPCAAI
jgi:hypothetical protein